MVLNSLEIDINKSENKVKDNILEFIAPIVFSLCSGVQSKLDFIDLSIKSANLIGFLRPIDVKESFSSYLKDLKIE